MKPVLVLDNYDSFTYNLVHLLRECGARVEVFRNNKISLEEAGRYDQIVLSPGPGIPEEAGIMPTLVRTYAPHRKILGVCLGHQCIAEVFGARLRNLGTPVHGESRETIIVDDRSPLFRGLPNTINTGRYHSWVVAADSIPLELAVTAQDSSGEVMALSHRRYQVHGVQFHPESVLTQFGREMISNFLGL